MTRNTSTPRPRTVTPAEGTPTPRRLPGTAVFSPCERYRYLLTRSWTRDPRDGLDTALPPEKIERGITFLMLNPSTATAEVDDPTIRRCIGYARRWGASDLIIANLFGLRATDPRRLRTTTELDGRPVADPVGPDNDVAILHAVRSTSMTVCAWGNHGTYRGRGAAVLGALRSAGMTDRLHYLTLTLAGTPGHPLYLAADLPPKAWGP